MEDVIPTLVVAVLGMLGVFVITRARGKYTRVERRYIGWSVAAHLVASPVLVWLTEGIGGGGDMHGYAYHGRLLARMMERDFVGTAPLVLRLFVQRDEVLGAFVTNANTSTGSVTALSGFLMLPVNGSIYAACMIVSFMGLFGMIALYRVFRETLDVEDRPPALLACMLLPTVVHWSSGIMKEAIIFGPFCLMVLGAHRVVTGRLVPGLVLLALGGLFVGLIKPYILFPFTVAAGVWLYWQRQTQKKSLTIRPIYLLLALAVCLGGVAALGSLFPEYAVEALPEHTSRLQALGREVEGGSFYELGEAEERSLLGQLAYAPAALVTTFFRPFIFEVRNVTMFVTALETTALLVVTLRVVLTRKWRVAWAYVMKTPVLVFALTFSVLLGIGVGLATTNLGTLSRYRIPLMPFFAVVVLVGRRRVIAQPAAARPRVAAEQAPQT